MSPSFEGTANPTSQPVGTSFPTNWPMYIHKPTFDWPTNSNLETSSPVPVQEFYYYFISKPNANEIGTKEIEITEQGETV